MASLAKVTMSFCIVVALVLCNVSNIKADTETGDDLFFEWEREMEMFNISCLPGGSWDEPNIWPTCVPCKIFISSKI